MKKVSLWVILFSFPVLLISCSIPDEITEETEVITKLNEVLLKNSELIPQNNANEYDSIGILQNHLLDIYLSANHNHTSIEEVNDEIQSLIFVGTGLFNSIPTHLVVDQIIDIMNSPESSLNTIISNSHLTNEAKSNLTDFIDSLLLLQDEEYEDIYQFIIFYESSVIENRLLNNEDKRVILITSSIARHSIYYERNQNDKDWEVSVGNITAAVYGALEDSLTAINFSLVTGISLNIPFEY